MSFGGYNSTHNKCQWKHNDPKSMGCSKSSSNREVYSNSISPQETIKDTTSIKQTQEAIKKTTD